MIEPILVATGLQKTYGAVGRSKPVRAVTGVDLTLTPGRTTALVGESGSGKSTIAKMLLGLESPTGGELTVNGEQVSRRHAASIAYHRIIQLVFQDPFASLNPFHTVGHHLVRPLLLADPRLGRRQAAEKALDLLRRVQLEPAESYVQRRPHQLSGGQRQRVAIARALAPEPRILIADEPVSMLDVSIRLGILNLLADIQRERNLAVLYITHDLATARHFSDEILVMYRGEIVERGPSDQVILDPQHEYTRRLASAAPDPERRFSAIGRRDP